MPLKDVAEWVEPYRKFWEVRFASLDDYLTVMQDEKAVNLPEEGIDKK